MGWNPIPPHHKDSLKIKYHETLKDGRDGRGARVLLNGKAGTCQSPHGSEALKFPLHNEVQDERNGPEAPTG